MSLWSANQMARRKPIALFGANARMRRILLCLAVMSACACAFASGGWDGVWSPDGKRIAYAAGSPLGVPNVWIMEADGKGARRLSSLGARAPYWLPGSAGIGVVSLRSGSPRYYRVDPSAPNAQDTPTACIPDGAQGVVWSADGSQIAYALNGKDGAFRNLWVAASDGSNPRGVTTNFLVRQYAWSPDGKQLAVVIGRAIGSSLWIVKPDTKAISMLYEGFCASPSYSPDGKYLVFAVPANREDHRIVCIETATGKRLVVPVKSYDGNPVSWSPDSKRFVFASETRTDSALWVAGVDGRELVRVTPPEIQAFGPAFSPDGRKILFAASLEDAQGIDLFTCDADVSVPYGVVKSASPDLARYHRLTTSAKSEFAPALSPDGKRMVISVLDKGMGALFITDSKGGARKKLLDCDPSASQHVVWSPDGKQIGVAVGSTLQVFRASGGAATITLSCKGETGLSWSADSKMIYFTEWREGRAGISVYDMAASETRQVTRGGEKQVESAQKTAEPTVPKDVHSGLGVAGPVATEQTIRTTAPVNDLYPSVSPDGKRVAFVREDQVWTIDSDGKNERQLTHISPIQVGMLAVYTPSWSPDGSNILFQIGISGPSGLSWEIWTADTTTGETDKLISEQVESEYGRSLRELSAAPCYTPDGKWVIYTSCVYGASVAIVPATGGKSFVVLQGPAAFGSIGGGKLACVSFAGDDMNVVVRELKF